MTFYVDDLINSCDNYVSELRYKCHTYTWWNVNIIPKHTPHGIIRNKHFCPFQIKAVKGRKKTTTTECATKPIQSEQQPHNIYITHH